MTKPEWTAQRRTKLLKTIALQHGFESCRIARADFLEEEAPRLEQWLKDGKHGKMGYMENHFDLRLDPRRLVDGARSVVTLVYSYFPQKELPEGQEFKVSKYAYGEDYHRVIREKLKALVGDFQKEVGEVGGRVFVDSAPVLEKAWAVKNGTGWLGKHTNVLHPKMGSFFFLCELILDIELEADQPITDHCGTCTRCIDACPTEAILAPYQLDASRCISYLTIELREAIPTDFQGKMENWIFGCDVCQDVCPWNQKFSIVNTEPRFQPSEELLGFKRKDWLDITEEIFNRVFSRSAIKRTKLEGLKRNIAFAQD
ncbi:MAG TPA: tRNA epoxyqueuosine(34) reductase QueG [Catalimonadaceae bacterium]|jgi:epoxyqueuosine reductase|nr:tRNA epoxyqueuosine(34) reductase QueG [Catalimonadaceae bacterium]